MLSEAIIRNEDDVCYSPRYFCTVFTGNSRARMLYKRLVNVLVRVDLRSGGDLRSGVLMLTLKRADVGFEQKARVDLLCLILGQTLTGS